MNKPLWRQVMLLISIVCLILLITIAVKVGVFTGININIVFMSIASILTNSYVSGIMCSILAVLIIYCIQVRYSKRMLKKDFRCNEIIQDLYDGIKSYCNIADKIPQKQERKSDENYLEIQKEYALTLYEFYKKNRAYIDIINLSLCYTNNDILIDSVQSCFFINLNFKLLNIINNIKNRLPNLRNGYPEIKKLFENYEAEGEEKDLINLGYRLPIFLIDLRLMVIYWKQLLDYLGYDPTYIKMFIEIYNSKYEIEEDIKQTIKERDRRVKEINKLTKRAMMQYRLKHFWDK